MQRYMKRLALLFCFFIIFFPYKSFCQQAIDDGECLACHDSLKVEPYSISAHASKLFCTSCHSDIREVPHSERLAKVNCAGCHSVESREYGISDHGKAVKNGIAAAGCSDCHGEPHAILQRDNPLSLIYHLNIPRTCAKCHEDEEKIAKYDLLEKKPVASYLKTVHGRALTEQGMISAAVCTDCHGTHSLFSQADPKSKIYRLNVPSTCGKCHKDIFGVYSRSIHGKSVIAGKFDAPVCTDCHGEHTIKSHKDPASSVYQAVITEKTCGQCHTSERIASKYKLPSDRLETYFESYHGLASKLGVTTVANCASCHGVHNILPSSDPDSTIHKDNIPHTCGKCHDKAGVKLAQGSIHVAPSLEQDKAVYYVSLFYILLISLTIGGMLVHNIIYLLPKLREHYRKNKEEAKYTRFTINERLQHFVLVVSFILLAYTGFALRYPAAWWAWPFTAWSPGFDWRGVAHRTLAIIFGVLAVYHICYLSLTKRGKTQSKELLPGKNDFIYFFGLLKYNIGISKQKPEHTKKYDYAEKTEYWALVWGSFIMIATGLMLTFENIFLQNFPKWALDVARAIHYYEAILAVLAILIWHMFFIIFEPDHYPINLSMLFGKSTKKCDETESDIKNHPPKA